jgi:hypothetical protein
MWRWCVLLLAVEVAVISGADARERGPVREFRKVNVCPATGQHKGPCPGWVVDHIVPLCAQGADHPVNMQWQELKESRQKDKLEISACARLRKQCRP